MTKFVLSCFQGAQSPPMQHRVDEGGGFGADVGGGAAQAVDGAEMGQSHSPQEAD